MEHNHPQPLAPVGAIAPDQTECAARFLAQRYGIDAAFVRVSELARILGLAAPTIYAAMKAGRFPIPHRKVGTTPLVKLEDLARWYCAQEAPSQPQASTPARDENRPSVIDDDAKEKLVKSVLREMRGESR